MFIKETNFRLNAKIKNSKYITNSLMILGRDDQLAVETLQNIFDYNVLIQKIATLKFDEYF